MRNCEKRGYRTQLHHHIYFTQVIGHKIDYLLFCILVYFTFDVAESNHWPLRWLGLLILLVKYDLSPRLSCIHMKILPGEGPTGWDTERLNAKLVCCWEQFPSLNQDAIGQTPCPIGCRLLLYLVTTCIWASLPQIGAAQVGLVSNLINRLLGPPGFLTVNN